MGCCGCTEVDDGSGGGGSGGPLAAFTYTATGAEGSDFFIPITGAPLSTDNYIPQVTKGGGAQQELYDYKMPDDVALDRTTAQFRIIVGADVRSGDKLDVVIFARIP